jgi:hypothetical protein
MRGIFIGIAVLVLGAATVSADFSYTQTTRVTGGTLLNMTRFMPGAGQLREPTTQTIAVKGGKMVTYNADLAMIIDADAETMTQIDFKKKQYAVITFAEMKQAMQAMRAQLAQAQAQLAQAQAQQQAPPVNPLDAIKVSVNETGQSKVISGLNTKQFILTMEMGGAPAGAPPNTPSNKTTMDTWMAPTLPGYEEVTAFGVKMASKMSDMATPGMNPMAMFREDVAKSVNTMAKEMSKMTGIPVYQTMTMTGMQPAGPNVGDAAKGAAVDAAGQAAAGAALGKTRLGGLGGALGGFGRKKEEAKPADQAAPVTLQPVVLMEQVTELNSLSATVDASKFAVPTGFKQVEHEMKKLVKQ